ncbi:hypothetical protein [Dactylosporangium sp. NPDC005555]|uniref:hypothetical protein n=1 Tax=Dactylosporangium sp. NPDC005555 TaxID=3154889 RepID=UPI0033B4DE48
MYDDQRCSSETLTPPFATNWANPSMAGGEIHKAIERSAQHQRAAHAFFRDVDPWHFAIAVA